MSRKIIFLILLCGLVKTSFSQSNLLWTKTYPANLYSSSYSPSNYLDQDTLVSTGVKQTSNGTKLVQLKHDLNGQLLSEIVYGNELAFASSIVAYQFHDDFVYLLCREQINSTSESNIVMQKYDKMGLLLTSFIIPLVGDTNFYPGKFSITNEGNYLIFIAKNYYVPGDDIDNWEASYNFLYSFSPNGDKLWERSLQEIPAIKSLIYGSSFINDTTYIAIHQGGFPYRILRVSPDNEITSMAHPNMYGAGNIQASNDGNLLLTGAQHFRLTKMTQNGTVLWTTSDFQAEFPNNDNSVINYTKQDTQGNIYMTGAYDEDDGDTLQYKVLTLKYDMYGNLLWSQKYSSSRFDEGQTIQLKNGFVYIGGQSQQSEDTYSSYDHLVLKIDATTGALVGDYKYRSSESTSIFDNNYDNVTSLAITDEGNVALIGIEDNESDGYNWLIQYISDLTLSTSNVNLNSFHCYPNPVNSGDDFHLNGEALISVAIYSPEGKLLKDGEITGSDMPTISTAGMKSGLYLVKVHSKTVDSTIKLVVR